MEVFRDNHHGMGVGVGVTEIELPRGDGVGG